MDSKGRQFTNELGNAINVQVYEKQIDGVDGVVIFISGPTSQTENHVTLLEAKVICEELEKVVAIKENR